MAEDYSYRPSTAAHGGGKLRTALIIALVAFMLGVAGTGYLAYRAGFDFGGAIATEQTAAPLPVLTAPSPSSSAGIDQAAAEAAQAVERVAVVQGGIDQRVAAMEQRLARLDLQSQAAAGNAARAEGLLIAFATRRALERGAPLGYLADQLTLRFGNAQPNAVRTVIAAAANPVTLDQLLARLEGLGPRLASNPRGENAVGFMQRQLSELFIVRRESVASPQPMRRLDRARMFLESGRIDSAVDEVRRLPNAAEAAPWIADARRYAEVQRALDTIETTAILEPRKLRDGTGNSVEQLSPAAGN